MFYPYPAWCISVSNPKRRITTGGTGEYRVLSIAVLLLVIGLHIGSAGGLTERLTASLGMVDGAVEVYNQKSASYAVYKTGQQILSDRITATIGNPATTQLQTVSFVDEEIAPKLQEIAASQPNALILLSGSIVVDLPENVRIPIEANRFQTAKVADKTVTMTFHPIELALQQLGEQYVTGTLTVKAISPRPQ